MTADTPAYLLELVGGDRGVAREILAEFLASDEQDRANLQAALVSGDVAAIHTHAHRIKGAARSVGASRYAEAAERLETAAAAGANLGELASEISAASSAVADWHTVLA